jgi:5'-3' exonuclease
MGIKKLFTMLNNNNLYKTYPYLNDLIAELNIDKKKLLVGVDGNLFCHKYTHSYDNMFIGFFNQILKFLSNKIIPIYIFDGGTLPEKENTNIMRNQKKILSKHKLEQLENLLELDNNLYDKIGLLVLKKKLEKNSMKINTETILSLLELFDLLNIPYIFSHGEGEYLAVLLNKYNIIDMFLSDDTDPIPAGINKIIKFYNNNVYYLDTKLIHKKLLINSEEFCDFCILLGSDYLTFNHGMKPNELLELIKKYKSIENIHKNNIMSCLTDESFIMISKIRKIYNNSDLDEKSFILGNYDNNKSNINLLIDHSNISFYSNIMLEFWDDLIIVLNSDNSDDIINNSDNFKHNVYEYISNKKFNTKNILKFIKNNIKDITKEEITNMIISFDFLNTFGI